MNIQTSLFLLPLDKSKSLQTVKNITEKISHVSEEQAKTSDSITVLLNTLFPEQQHQDREIKQAKTILSGLSLSLNAEEIQVMIYEIQHLVTCWTDLFERKILKDKTLKELLNEG